MKKIALVITALVVASGCNLMKKTGDTSGEGGVATADTGSASTTTVSGILSKALSFATGGPFEGEITMNMTDASKPPHTITYDVKGTKMRFDAPGERGGGGYVIFDGATKKMLTVDDTRKMAIALDMNQAATAAAESAAKKPAPTIDKTGKMDTVAGYSCEIWKVTEPNGDKNEVCIAKGIAFPSMGKQSAGWMSALEDSFPLRAVTSDPTGKEKTRLEVTKIEKKSIDDAKFEVPAGYKTMSLEDMMKGMGGMGGPGGMRPPR